MQAIVPSSDKKKKIASRLKATVVLHFLFVIHLGSYRVVLFGAFMILPVDALQKSFFVCLFWPSWSEHREASAKVCNIAPSAGGVREMGCDAFRLFTSARLKGR